MKARGKYCVNYSEHNVAEAIKYVKAGNSTLKASKLFKIPYQTLRDKYSNKHPKIKGTESILNADEEVLLKDWIFDMAKRGMPRSRFQVLEAAKEISMINHRKKKFKNLKPSNSWLAGFFHRHDDVRLRTSESLGRASANVSENNLRNWFNHVEQYLKEEGFFEILSDPSRVCR